MTVKQISVFVENSAGKLAELTEYLNQHDIDMRALSIAETQDFGIVRMIVNDAYKASCVLKEAGYVASITPVLAVEMPDEPGSLFRILKILGDGCMAKISSLPLRKHLCGVNSSRNSMIRLLRSYW